MKYQWDKKKAKSNHKKHNVYFADAVAVFSDKHAVCIEDEVNGEKRFIILGMDAFARILVVVYTWCGEEIRIISARKATPKERKQYGEKP